jgi:hypothetical protein
VSWDDVKQFLSVLNARAVDLYLEGRTLRDLAADLEAAAKVGPADLNRLASRLGDLKQGVLVLVGDKKKVLPQLKGLGLPEPTVLKP